jgi:hypothetical protein
MTNERIDNLISEDSNEVEDVATQIAVHLKTQARGRSWNHCWNTEWWNVIL